jgi:hypothetical protein
VDSRTGLDDMWKRKLYGPRPEPETSRTRSVYINHSTAMLLDNVVILGSLMRDLIDGLREDFL